MADQRVAVARAKLSVLCDRIGQLVGVTRVERLDEPMHHFSITYEEGDDQIAIGLGGRGKRFPSVLWHFIDEPRRVIVTREDDELTAIVIESEDEALTLVRLHKT